MKNIVSPISITYETHLVPLIFELSRQGIMLGALPVQEQEVLQVHLATCRQCKWQLAILHYPDERAGEQSPAGESHDAAEPDDIAISMFAAMMDAEGAPAAQAAYPAMAEHLAGCEQCRAKVAADRAAIHPQNEPSPSSGKTPVIAPIALLHPMWDNLDQEHRMLAGTVLVMTHRQWVHVESTIPAMHIETAYTGSVEYLAGTAVPQQEERFTIDLRESHAATFQPWLRLAFYLRALWSGTLLCKLTATLVAADPVLEEPAESVAWRIEDIDAEGGHTIIRQGVTGDDGSSDIVFPRQVNSLCCVDWQGITWEIPIEVQKNRIRSSNHDTAN